MSELNSNRKNRFGLKEIVILYVFMVIIITIVSIVFYQKNGSSMFEYITQNYIAQDKQIEENVISNELEKQENIIISNELEDQENNIDQSDINKEITGASLTDKYYINNIEITTEEIVKGNIIEYDYAGNPVYKLTAKYAQISGLKDKSVEDKINQTIKQKVEDLIIDSEIYDESVYMISINIYSEMANFNDVLSLVRI